MPTLEDAQADRLAGLCADLPLALRVAGSYLQETAFAPNAYLEELAERRLQYIAESARDIERPELDPMVVLGHSYDRLAESEPLLARTFTLLGVFPADFDATAAAAVLASDDAARSLALLQRRSLVQQPLPGRYRLHDFLSDLATAKVSPNDKDTASARYDQYYLALLLQCDAEIIGRGSNYRLALRTVEQELVTLTAATQQAADRHDLEAAAPAQIRLGNVLSALGRHEEAVKATEEAVTLYRELAAARPDTFKPILAGSLSNLGNVLSALGRRERALAAIRDAVAIYRELAAARPDASMPDLAMSLNNCGNRLSELGRHEEAHASTEEAVTLYRVLAVERPDAFKPILADSLANLGNRVSDLGRYEAALEATEEALALRRQLAAARPDAFKADLATSLNNWGNRLGALGRSEEALKATEEAVALRRELAAERPDVFRPDLAMSLSNLAVRYDERGETEAAITYNLEAIEAISEPFFALPAAHARMMSVYFGNYVKHCQKLGVEPDEALLGPIVEVFQALQAEDVGATEE